MTELLAAADHPGLDLDLDPHLRLASAGTRPGRPLLGLDLTSVGSGAGAWAPAADETRPQVDQQRLAELVRLAERVRLDFAAFDEDFALAPRARRTTASRLDAARVACRLAGVTSEINLVATLDTSYLDPVHVATAVTTLHERTGGRAAWQVGASQARVLGDSRDVWERLAREIRAVVGPAARRPGAGARSARPAVVVRAGSEHSLRVAGELADVVRIEATDAHRARALRDAVRGAARAAGRDPDDVRVLVDVVVLLSPDAAAARARLDILEDLTPVEPAWRRTLSHLGSPGQLADLVDAWFTDGVVDGFTVLPGSLPHDLRMLVGEVLPVLRERNLARAVTPAA